MCGLNGQHRTMPLTVQYNYDRLVIVKRRPKKYSLQLATEQYSVNKSKDLFLRHLAFRVWVVQQTTDDFLLVGHCKYLVLYLVPFSSYLMFNLIV